MSDTQMSRYDREKKRNVHPRPVIDRWSVHSDNRKFPHPCTGVIGIGTSIIMSSKEKNPLEQNTLYHLRGDETYLVVR